MKGRGMVGSPRVWSRQVEECVPVSSVHLPGQRERKKILCEYVSVFLFLILEPRLCFFLS